MPAINPRIFREYDIRGIVDEDLTPSVVTTLGRAYGAYLGANGSKTVAVGYDARVHSPLFRDALIEGITSTGLNVVDVGMVPTPLVYFALYQFDLDGGVMITASHNPPEYNGFKVCVGKTTLSGAEIQQFRSTVEKGSFPSGQGRHSTADIIGPYIEYCTKHITLEQPVKVVVDAGNGTGGLVGPAIMRQLGCEVKELYCEPDGTFPNHHPDPTVEAYIQDLKGAVTGGGYEVGIGYDGDADRLGVVDERGTLIFGDMVLLLAARDVLTRHPGATIICEVKCSQTLVEEVERRGGRCIMWKTGHSPIKKKLAEEGALLAGEMSGHLFFADEYFGYDDAIYASLRLLRLLAVSGQSLSSMLADVPPTYATPEIRVACPEERKFALVEELAATFKERYEVLDVDGARVNFEDGWGLVRASNTQPVLVLRFEGTSHEALERAKDIILSELRRYPEVEGLEVL
ncbi:MAG: phosphomannomutase/phosphoglucomutase [Candidatus Tectimicrobiota bacterium]